MDSPSTDKTTYPLCVDLDGTLIKTDLLVESFFALLKNNFFFVFVIPFWLRKGKAYLKQQIADRVDLDVSLLPFNETVLDYVKSEAARGRPIVLATASNSKYAQQIADYLGLFTVVLASDSQVNRSGPRKLEYFLEEYGDKGFDYAGNALVDLSIWRHSKQAILVDPNPGVKNKALKTVNVTRIIVSQSNKFTHYIKAIRTHQWLKNLLIFIPLATAHAFGDVDLVIQSILAFFSFCFCASGIYLINDLLDLPSDRAHPRKRRRPFAAGTVNPLYGMILIPSLLLISLAIALFLPSFFLVILAVYFFFTTAYSLFLKRLVLIDVLVLAGLYTLRVIAGAAAISVEPSFWLLAFSMFLFLSLALVKRAAELQTLRQEQEQKPKGRGYRVTDMEYLHSMGTASGYLAVLVTALYINSPNIAALYSQPEILWLICPVLLYWISRMWLKTGRGEMHDDPLVFAVKDSQSLVIGLAVFIALLVAV